ncbi:MAG: hypothetical protein AAB838_04355 [Patescibacteria group bacterium]
MITILHGEDEVASRRELDRIISGFEGQIIRFEKTFDLTDLYQATSGLFNDKVLVIIENYLGGKKKLDLDAGDANVIFWEPKEVSKTVIGINKSLEFKIPTLIWKLCDSLKPTNGKQILPLFENTLKTTDIEFIFAMLIRQFRLMLNPVGLAPWQASKIQSQSKVFGEENLKNIYQQLLTIDYENKTSLSPLSLKNNLEKFLLWI